MRLVISAQPSCRDLCQHQGPRSVAIKDAPCPHQPRYEACHMIRISAVAGPDGDKTVVDAMRRITVQGPSLAFRLCATPPAAAANASDSPRNHALGSNGTGRFQFECHHSSFGSGALQSSTAKSASKLMGLALVEADLGAALHIPVQQLFGDEERPLDPSDCAQGHCQLVLARVSSRHWPSLESELIHERTMARLQAARARGRTSGRKVTLTKA